MANSYFQFKQFTIHQDRTAMKVTTDGCLFGAWVADRAWSRETGVRSLLDIGSGTGLLSLMLAQKVPAASVDAIEIDKDAFEQANQNAKDSPWSDRVNIIHADAREFSFSKRYDTIICNPPFYENELKGESVKKNIAHHDAGLLLPELLELINTLLVPGGNFYLLLPYKRNAEIKQLLREKKLPVEEIVFVRQSPGHDYFRMMIKGRSATDGIIETKIAELRIKENGDEYSSGFRSLLKDYYLHL